MFQLINKAIDGQEKSLGASLDYLRQIAKNSLGAFFKFALFTPLSTHRRRLPVDAYSIARIVATERKDCGTCVQIVVNAAPQ